jgi:hypothetical protein
MRWQSTLLLDGYQTNDAIVRVVHGTQDASLVPIPPCSGSSKAHWLLE